MSSNPPGDRPSTPNTPQRGRIWHAKYGQRGIRTVSTEIQSQDTANAGRLMTTVLESQADRAESPKPPGK